MYLDHVALGTRDAKAPLDVLVGELGGTVLSGGLAIGYRPMQVFLGDAEGGMKVELLEPWAIEQNDFFERFLVRHGEGPHHLTFKVEDLEATLARVEAAGYTPVGVDLSLPLWREAFLQPKEAHGTVVQLASSTAPAKSPLAEYERVRANGIEAETSQPWWPEHALKAESPTYLRRVVLGTPRLSHALDFFGGLLAGDPVADADGVELAWPGGGRIRLEARDTPGIDRLELEGPGPARSLTVAGTRFDVRPPPNDSGAGN